MITKGKTEKNYDCNNIERLNCITGKENHLYPQLKEAMNRAISIDIIVSFVRETGVKLLKEDLKEAIDSNKRIRILTGNYLNITQPTALYLLKEIMGRDAAIHFYSDKSRSFHSKAYIFHYKNGEGDIFLGSSNMSRMALKQGVEWNYRIQKRNSESDFSHFFNEFENLFYNESILVDDAELRRYSKNWKKPKVEYTLDEIEDKPKGEMQPKEIEGDNIQELFTPRGPQIEALYELNKKREADLDKALVVAATGIGKTYLAAFDSLKYEKVLFVAHKKEILDNAEQTFRTVRPQDETGFFMNTRRETDKKLIFASVQTLGKNEYLNEEYFSPEYFDYVVIDESHHGVANSYRRIIEYFKPKFLLGLTATPDRLDNKDVYSLFDYNIAYEVYLHEAINKGWLVPFRYYGVYDHSVDYNKIDFKNGKYDDKQLEKALTSTHRADLIIKHYKKFRSSMALGFCSNRSHAEYMAEQFIKQGIKACAVYSGKIGKNGLYRDDAIDKLKSGEINIIFSVDMFNEGVDIKSIDMVLLLRPTESPTVFLQQLGRGLRKDGKKKYLNVIDFIGNYKKVDMVPIMLKGTKNNGVEKGFSIPKEEDFPEGCIIDFDIEAIDLIEKSSKSNLKIKELIDCEFLRISEDLKNTPSRHDMFTYMDESILSKMRSNKKINILKNYMSYLNQKDRLSKGELALLGTKAEEFINMIENTAMSKSYKMPLLLAFYNKGNLKMKINEDDVFSSFYRYYMNGSNGYDLYKEKSYKDYKSWGKKQYLFIANNPKGAFAQKTSEFFYKEDSLFCLNDDLEKFIENPEFIKHFKDAIELRSAEYYKTRYEKEYKL